MNPERHTLSKDERLCGKKDISRLLSGGRFSSLACFRYCVLKDNGYPHSRILVSVPKKAFKRAVKRNLLKRRIRESYRLQKDILSSAGICADIMFVYSPKEVLPFTEIYGAVGKTLCRITEDDEKRQERK